MEHNYTQPKGESGKEDSPWAVKRKANYNEAWRVNLVPVDPSPDRDWIAAVIEVCFLN